VISLVSARPAWTSLVWRVSNPLRQRRGADGA
jgi:hypothetical protein